MSDKKRNILVIDDEQEVREVLKDFLESRGFSVTLASNGADGLDSIKREIPNLIIIDLLLPGEHGINLIKTVKDQYFIPVIIVSGIYNRQEIDHIMEEYFVECFLEKPVDLDKLTTEIDSILD
jgi:DNA-binding NtrC family response regulator